MIPTLPAWLRRTLAALWMAGGLGTVAVLGYGGGCDNPDATNLMQDANAATGYLVHDVGVNTGGFECKFRCVASLISWNVIATSRTCLELYQARYQGQSTFNYKDANWAFGASNTNDTSVCEGLPSNSLAHDAVQVKYGNFYNTTVQSKAQGNGLKSLYRVWRTVPIPWHKGDKPYAADIKADGDLVLMILDRPVRGIQPYEFPGATIPDADHGTYFKYTEPHFRLTAYTPKGQRPMQAAIPVTGLLTQLDDTGKVLGPGDKDKDKYTYSSLADRDKLAISNVQTTSKDKYVYGNVHAGEGCYDSSGNSAGGLHWVYPDFRAMYHTTLNDDSGTSLGTNDNFVNQRFAIGFVGSPVLQAGMFWGVMAGYGHSWNRAGCVVSKDYREFESGFGVGSFFLGIIAGFVVGALISIIAPYVAPALSFVLSGVVRIATIIPRFAQTVNLARQIGAAGRIFSNARRFFGTIKIAWRNTEMDVRYLTTFRMLGKTKANYINPLRKTMTPMQAPAAGAQGPVLPAMPAPGAKVTIGARWGYGVTGAAAGPAATAATSKVRSVAYTAINDHVDVVRQVVCQAEAAIMHAGCGVFACPNAVNFLNGGSTIYQTLDACDISDIDCWIPPIPSVANLQL